MSRAKWKEMILLEALRRWANKRHTIRRRWQRDTRALVARDERKAYYEAQRLVARHRARGDAGEGFHWAKVAAEIARIAPGAEMDIDVVREVVDDELDRPRPGSTRRI